MAFLEQGAAADPYAPSFSGSSGGGPVGYTGPMGCAGDASESAALFHHQQMMQQQQQAYHAHHSYGGDGGCGALSGQQAMSREHGGSWPSASSPGRCALQD